MSTDLHSMMETSPFLRELLMQIRAQDTYGVWEAKPDEAVLSAYVLDREARRRLPVTANPEPKILFRLKVFYNAVGLTVERQSGFACQPMVMLHEEGFGRVVMLTGRLVAFSRFLRDVHRFGFESIDALAFEGDRMVGETLGMIRQFYKPAVTAC